MKITVTRSGGIAGIRRTWIVIVEEQADSEDWNRLVSDLPWDARVREPAQPDRFVYEIRASRRRITLPERHVTGPWRELVDRVRAADEPSAQ